MHENYHKDLRIAMMRWKAFRDVHAKRDADYVIGRNNKTILKLKERINYLENDNQVMIGENEELRNFSLEGFEIANTVKELDAEKKRLQGLLEDEDKTMQDLYD